MIDSRNSSEAMCVYQTLNMEEIGQDDGHCGEDNMDSELGSTSSDSTLTAMACTGMVNLSTLLRLKYFHQVVTSDHSNIVFQPAEGNDAHSLFTLFDYCKQNIN